MVKVMDEKKIKYTTVSLVLGSGGARGYAHIGVINSLIEHGFEIRSISGCSMGALIGGIYATGKLDIYSNWVTALEKSDALSLLDFSFSKQGLFKGDRIINILKDMIGYFDIQDLPISYTAVATDINAQKEIWINKGSLFDAIRASIAIPMIFTPHNYLGMQLLDGSVINPLPIAPTLNDKTDITIAVNPNSRPDLTITKSVITKKIKNNNTINYRQKIMDYIVGLKSKKQQAHIDTLSTYDLISKTSETMQSKITGIQLAAYSPDIVISIPRNSCSFYEFYRAQELIDIGYEQANKSLQDFVST
ncbi:FIG00613342: Bacterial patatin-like phospholipase domain containing protein [hydrothermal vent metagenome]|uniref:FIG00613342: Bacterial patatin-like phospholipase domain containing protein n=1 Tax=hydrothermal vent metagenome TaxID=652676 RepID=A0A3B0ZT47_9ZZZZ